MTDFLDHLAARADDSGPVIEPRRLSRFETETESPIETPLEAHTESIAPVRRASRALSEDTRHEETPSAALSASQRVPPASIMPRPAPLMPPVNTPDAVSTPRPAEMIPPHVDQPSDIPFSASDPLRILPAASPFTASQPPNAAQPSAVSRLPAAPRPSQHDSLDGMLNDRRERAVVSPLSASEPLRTPALIPGPVSVPRTLVQSETPALPHAPRDPDAPMTAIERHTVTHETHRDIVPRMEREMRTHETRTEILPRREPSAPEQSSRLVAPPLPPQIHREMMQVESNRQPLAVDTHDTPAAPTIHISIGRIEVRAQRAASAAQPAPKARELGSDLAAYLRSRGGKHE